MAKDHDFLQDVSFLNEIKPSIGLGKIGIEKECFRFNHSGISSSEHPKSLGSALTNRFITTDFSEGLLEFVTAPFEKHTAAINFLDNIHFFALDRLQNELLLPFSIPPNVISEDEIIIAHYGSSNLAKLKMTYRKGLSSRYGNFMQAISGIHFNYSLHPETIEIIISREKQNRHKFSKSDIYFRTIRNLNRFNWIIIYLFGSSPVINRNLLTANKTKYKRINDMYLMEHATSMRMSDIGYYVKEQEKLDVSLNNLEEHVESLRKYTTLVNPKFEKIQNTTKNIQSQISPAYLQIEDEYYSNARPKSSLISGERMISKLKKTGVDYIELRTLDVNPFEKAGIGIDDLKFLEAFMIFCTLFNSPEMSFKEIKAARHNDLLVSKYGRKDSLILNREGKQVTLKAWATEILSLMEPIFDLLSFDRSLINIFEERIKNIDQTLSSKLIDLMDSERLNYIDLAEKIALSHKDEYEKHFKKSNNIQDTLSKEAINSIKKQEEIEHNSDESFNEYLSNYLDS